MIDVVQERVVLQVQFPSDVGPAFLKQTSRHLCCCTDAGHVLTLDPKTLKLQVRTSLFFLTARCIGRKRDSGGQSYVAHISLFRHSFLSFSGMPSFFLSSLSFFL